MKKLIAAILLGILLLGIGVSCTPKEPADEGTTPTERPAGDENQQSMDDLLGE